MPPRSARFSFSVCLPFTARSGKRFVRVVLCGESGGGRLETLQVSGFPPIAHTTNRFHGEMSRHLRPRRSPRWTLSCRECERVTSLLAAQAGSLETTLSTLCFFPRSLFFFKT